MRIFISATFVDLKPHRQAVYDAIIGSDLAAENMIYWSADERSPADLSVARVHQSDAMILVLAHRYGHIPEGSQKSITELEYETARAVPIPVLAFLIDEETPWPPQHVDWNNREHLLAFKKRILEEVTAKTFNGPDHLASLASQALAGLRLRNAGFPTVPNWSLPSVHVDSIVDAALQPDVNLQIGVAEDGLPLLLSVKRSRDCSEALNSLERLTTRAGFDPPTALLSSFSQLIEEQANQAGRSHAITKVKMLDGSFENLLVCRPNLSVLFKSVLASLLERPGHVKRNDRRPGTWESLRRATAPGAAPKPLQSVGGSNRFLGIALSDGRCFSVGQEPASFGANNREWVEWRPFLVETLVARFPDAAFAIGGQTNIRSDRYFDALAAAVASGRQSGEAIDLDVAVEIPKSAIAGLVRDVATQIESQGVIHGDLKPQNILITSAGTVLIDSFQLSPGDAAPGWTPNWSAPEQFLGDPVCFESDVYPFGRFICELLEGHQVGEVRKFRVANPNTGSEEFDLFYDPAIRVYSDESLPTQRLKDWLDLARRCLRFNPAERPSRPALIAELTNLLEICPPDGVCRMRLDKHLVRASFPGGSVGIARRIICDMRDQLVPLARPFITPTPLPPRPLSIRPPAPATVQRCNKCMADNAMNARFCKLCSSPLGGRAKLCPRGLHAMDPTWSECCYCKAETRTHQT